MKLVIQLVLLVASAFMGYMIYDSIDSKIKLEEEIDDNEDLELDLDENTN